jgi:hypothetical protein
MRKIGAILGFVVVAGASLSVAVPASAAFNAVVQLPDDTFYAPYGGPATVSFTFDAGDPATIFTVRLRRPGHGVIGERDYLVDPATVTSPHPVTFGWKDISVAAPTDHVIDVRRQNGTVVTSEIFTLLPALVSDVTASPATFYPVIDDGYRDTTEIGFTLAADTTQTVVSVHEPNVYGRCCGTTVVDANLGPRAERRHTWTWDGTGDGSGLAPEGTYFVRVQATDVDGTSDTSRAATVELATGTIRLNATKTKVGSAYARVEDERTTALGGDCLVQRDTALQTTMVLCANAAISVVWRWKLDPGERIESVSFSIDGGSYGCHKKKSYTKTEAILRVTSPPTSTCTISEARILYSYPVAA